MSFEFALMNATTISYDCQTCGACCHSPWTGDGYVTLYEIDISRLSGTGMAIIEQVQGYGDSPAVIPKLGTRLDGDRQRLCQAFLGSIGATCLCTIYDQRPEACRRFEVGGSLCRDLRRRHGMPV